ncbi:MAG: hypothetical protein D8M57_13090 [Candidatus Scalindua sp. AMX11]|nr:MAG: hypothetical protein DWQ00_12000 [Candidatus Scalindua sp.]NOG83792.1 hypothetical protein [Planctomycetota bacterium]RZV82948.1 MAG: hypothetical protein EX341_09155 [Candidatus Scalindua sp. SCAELEC01]TDE64430.1 MAG: hypothetical protein D8M57_13090 [Candidatus Scalindua sp. AMX11]GJQ59757.1 MAG: hypothetical protein SCALA701_25580 [Candidatus Scalindua sp.]
MLKVLCKKMCVRGWDVLCVHFDNRYTLGAMRELCQHKGNNFKETESSALLFVDDIENEGGHENE